MWNEGARRMFGYTPEAVVGQATADIFYGPPFLGKPSRRNLLKAIFLKIKCLHDPISPSFLSPA